MKLCFVIFVFNSFIFSASAFTFLVPEGRELIYKYSAFQKASSSYPSSLASESFLHGKLHLQKINSSIFVQLSDLHFKIYNGEQHFSSEATEIPIPEDSSDLLNTFKVIYDTAGLAEEIIVEKNEKLYAINIHKAIAYILQLNTAKLEKKIFTSREFSVHGKNDVFYSVTTKGKQIFIKKMHDKNIDQSNYHSLISNIEAQFCQNGPEEMITRNGHQLYTIDQENDQHYLRHLQSAGGIYLYPFRTKTEAQYVYVNITLSFLENIPIKHKLKVKNAGLNKNIEFKTNSISDVLLSRRSKSSKIQLSNVQEMLEKIYKYLNDDPLHTRKPNVKQSQLINELVHFLTTLDEIDLEKAYKSLTNKKNTKLFYEVLPLVGTRPSIKLVKEVIFKKEVEDAVAMRMLHFLPSQVREANSELLKDIENMLSWNLELSTNVRKAAILSFASLVYKAKDTEATAKYVQRIVAKFNSTNDLELKVLYIQALHNTKSEKIVQILLPFIDNPSGNEHPLRLTSLWAVASAASKNKQLLYEIYWPIVTNPEEDIELRITAFYVIMESRPEMSKILNLYWELANDPHPDLYHFYYTYILAKYRTTDPCNDKFQMMAGKLLRLSGKPEFQALSGYYETEYFDEEHKWGNDFNNLIIAGNRSRTFKFEINPRLFNIRWNYYTIFFRIDGLEETFLEKIRLNLRDTSNLFNYEELFNLLLSLPRMKEINVQISIANNQKVIQSYYWDYKNLENLNDYLSSFLKDFEMIQDSIQIRYDIFAELVYPTEMGMLAKIELLAPRLLQNNNEIRSKIKDNFINLEFDNKLRILAPLRYGIAFYNPVADIWHGTAKYHLIDVILPLHGSITFDSKENTLEFRRKLHKSNSVGLRSHVSSYIYIKEDSNTRTLIKSCPSCKNWILYSKGDDLKYIYTKYKNSNNHFGYDYNLIIYDSELLSSYMDLNNVYHTFIQNTKKSYWNPLENLIILLDNMQMHIFLQPHFGSHGILIKITPKAETEFNLSYKKIIRLQTGTFLPGITVKMCGNYSLKINQEIRTWKFNGIFDLIPKHTFRNITFKLYELKNDIEDNSFSFENIKEWNKENVWGNTKFKFNDVTGNIRMIGKQLKEQLDPKHSYEFCQNYSHHLGNDYHSIHCTASHTSLRSYVYDIEFSNISSILQHDMYSYLDQFRQLYFPYYTSSFQKNNLTNHQIKILLDYSLTGYEINVEILKSHKSYSFAAVPSKDLSYWSFYPDNTHFSNLYLKMHDFGWVQTCVAEKDRIKLINNQNVKWFLQKTGEDWELLIRSNTTNFESVFFKKVAESNMVALKITHNSHVLEAYPLDGVGNGYKMLINNKEISNEIDYYVEEWFVYILRPNFNSVILTIFDLQLHIVYNGTQIVLEIPKFKGIQFYGLCDFS